MRRPVIAGNWKMFKTQAEARAFLIALKPLVASSGHCDIVIGAPFTALAAAVDAARGSAIGIAAQNVHWEKEGAFTGEISAKMLVEAGCGYVLIGHSERRQFFGETDAAVNKRVKAALDAELVPIVCVGELLAEREGGQMESVLERQFTGGLAALTAQQFSRIIVAYEPVWAIGTGRTATPEMAGDAHRFLRQVAATKFSPERAAALRILYGGSVKPDNIKGLMAQVEIDGALVGGASLDAQSFASIVNF
ncbi:MAG: triose-phosphate isomerase [Acidobacteria bacterium]|nr:triose-phosphate isomerase [Acidobacteriota bacterium]MBI3664194.1 triose-phosphate isomerase [Acidobacteriota bacterium]